MQKKVSQSDFDNRVAQWGQKRATDADVTPEEKEALKQANEMWSLGVELLQNTSMWKHEKDLDKIHLFSTHCPTLKSKIFKVSVEVNLDWKSVLVILMNNKDNPKWNDTLERVDLIVDLPKPAHLKNSSAWISYMRISAAASKIISQRDFCTCFQMEVTDDSAVYVGRHCDIPLCPHAHKLVRAEQKILAVQIKKLTDKSCMVTQVTSIAFKGAIMQPIIDSQMVKSLTSYAQCLINHAEKIGAEKKSHS